MTDIRWTDTERTSCLVQCVAGIRCRCSV